jgi:cell shape-determining protein MreD
MGSLLGLKSNFLSLQRLLILLIGLIASLLELLPLGEFLLPELLLVIVIFEVIVQPGR